MEVMRVYWHEETNSFEGGTMDRVETLFTDCDLEALKMGMDVELVIEKLHEDEQGNEIITYKFRPIEA